MHISPFIVDFDHFSWISIVVDYHPCIANYCDAANFTGVKPANMNVCIHAICKLQVEMGDVFDVRLYMGMRLHLDLLWFFTK